MSYEFLQHYWWFVVSLLGALLVFLMFVQGANSMIFSLGRTEEERRMVVNSTGRKWELTFTTLVTFGGAVATFFNGSNFIVDKNNIADGMQPVISRWANGSAGLDALLDVWNLVLGFAVFFLARVLGALYVMNNVNDENVRSRCRARVLGAAVPFLLFFVAFVIHVLVKDGYAYDAATGVISIVPGKYLDNMITMWYVFALFLIGVVLVVYAIVKTFVSKNYIKGIWPAGFGVVITVLSLLLCAGWNGTAYYPSNADLQSSLTIVNSCSSEFTLYVMAIVSVLVPFVLAYIAYVWHAMDRKKIDKAELGTDEMY